MFRLDLRATSVYSRLASRNNYAYKDQALGKILAVLEVKEKSQPGYWTVLTEAVTLVVGVLERREVKPYGEGERVYGNYC
jgi:hypothetical protein